jgi:hypothetical protein
MGNELKSGFEGSWELAEFWGKEGADLYREVVDEATKVRGLWSRTRFKSLFG